MEPDLSRNTNYIKGSEKSLKISLESSRSFEMKSMKPTKNILCYSTRQGTAWSSRPKSRFSERMEYVQKGERSKWIFSRCSSRHLGYIKEVERLNIEKHIKLIFQLWDPDVKNTISIKVEIIS